MPERIRHRCGQLSGRQPPHLLESIDQSIGRRIVGRHRSVVTEFRQDLAGQLFAQLDAPLVEAEDVPDDALDEDLVFVHGDQAAQSAGR